MASSIKPLMRTYKAGGAINPYSFVKFSTSSPGSSKNPAVVQCGAGDRPTGVAQNASAAASGDEVEVAFVGGGALLNITGTVTPGDSLKSDSSGYGIRTTSDADEVGAFAVEGGVSGDRIGVHVAFGQKGTTGN
jgi:hypothetical protein